MRQVSAALRAAIDAGERIIDGVFTVDFDNDGIDDVDDLSRKVDSVQVTQSLESSLPQQVQIVPGVAVAELTAKIARGNTVRYLVPVSYRALTTSSIAGSTNTWSVQRPTTARVGDVMLCAIFVSIQGSGSVLATWNILTKANVTWQPLSVRGDGGAGLTRTEGVLLYRRVGLNEPTTYTIDLPATANVLYGTACVSVGEQNIMGITDFVTKGEDNVTTGTQILLPQLKVDVPGSTIVSFFAASSYAISGTAFTPVDANDVEQTEFMQNGVTASRPSLRVGVNTHANAGQGLYAKGVNITGSVGSSAISSIAFGVVLAPKLAGDEAQHAAWTFSELNPNSPYAGKMRIRRRTKWSLRVLTENGMETVPLFTGLTTTPSASARTATIKALDNRETMTNTGQGLNIASVYPTSLDVLSGTSQPTMPGLETTWLVSRAFFLAFYRPRALVSGVFTYESQWPTNTRLGYFPSPLSSKFAGLWATMHGSAHGMNPTSMPIMYAYSETINHGLQHRVMFEVGPFVAATKNEAVGINTYMSWSAGTWQVWQTSSRMWTGRLQCWVRRNQTTSSLKMDFPDNNGNIYDAWVEVLSTGVVRVRVEIPSIGVTRTITGPTITADNTWHFLGVHFDSVAGSVRFRVDTTNTDVAMTTWTTGTIAAYAGSFNLTLTDGMQIAELQVDGGYDTGGSATGIPLSEAWANENFVPTAFVDKSENQLDAFPQIDPNLDNFGLVSDIANAEYAAFFFDADGYPHFRNSRSNASTVGQTIQRQITSRKSIKSIGYESGVQQVRNIISVPYTPFVASVNKEIFSASGLISVLAGTTQVITVQVQGPVIATFTPTYTAWSTPTGVGTNLTTLVDVTTSTSNAGQVDISIRNRSSATAFLVDNTGQPNLHVNATYFAPLSGVDTASTYFDTDSIRENGELPLTGNSSVWIQREDSAASLALQLLSDLCTPRPVITTLDIKGDPTLEFGDLVTIIDRDGLGINGQYRITRKDPSLSPDQGFLQSLSVRSAPTIAYWDTNYWDDGTVWG